MRNVYRSLPSTSLLHAAKRVVGADLEQAEREVVGADRLDVLVEQDLLGGRRRGSVPRQWIA